MNVDRKRPAPRAEEVSTATCLPLGDQAVSRRAARPHRLPRRLSRPARAFPVMPRR